MANKSIPSRLFLVHSLLNDFAGEKVVGYICAKAFAFRRMTPCSITTCEKPHSIRADIDDECETILLKCLAKDPARRYRTAGDFGDDLARYLAGEPIDAKRDSAMYVLRKTLWRYRGRAAIAALGLVLLLISSAGIFDDVGARPIANLSPGLFACGVQARLFIL